MLDVAKRDPAIVVVGAGPAGLRAVETLAAAGLRPILIDEAPRPGGQIYRQPPVGAERPARDLYGFEAPKAVALHRLLDRLGDRVDHRPDTLAWSLLENRLDLLSAGSFDQIDFDRVILATGAMDRVLPFAGWTTPGVFTLGAAQIALKAQGVAIGRRVALVGAGPLLPLVAHQYLKAGAEIAAVLDVTPLAPKIRHGLGLAWQPATLLKGLWYTAHITLAGHPIRFGVKSLRVEGGARVEALVWTDGRGREHRVACDAVGASFGLRSEAQLADLAGCRFTFDAVTRQWQPERDPEGRSSRADVYLAGDGAAIGGADVAELAGERTALTLLADLGRPVDASRVALLDRRLARQRRFRAALEAAYPFPGHLLDAVPDDEMVCRCEGITVGRLRDTAKVREAHEMNRLKAFTRIGMGRCQGRVCGQAAAEILARTLASEPAAVGRLRGNPPVKPIPVKETL
ncbi:FAD/NAD(P)-binding oxidoreductase [Siculibacillus lacustris]|uniref:FAD/NAD(P)-binding oxidoreductase n=1 Tax=Siculibacillus lacustris TaxID=1549641 RepID=A0A4Q9VTT5_9HYPH|nr:FAD/NAD(P)-binding oxidoreductase [Siculibacillus lacustris]TBW39524.1 FAD/NAD(P)-binding oxidoreductase [Siculibacillus lacustris]